MLDISIVVPVFNEEGNINPLFSAIEGVMHKLNKKYEIIFVDDGSTDKTLEEMKEIISKHKGKFKVIKFRRNYGQTAAMMAGFELAQGEVIISMDGDLQNDPRDIPILLNKIDEGYDLVSGWRKDRKDRLISRKIPSKAANWLIGRVTGVRIHDYGCSLKAYRKEVLKKMNLYSEMHRFIPAIAFAHGAKIAELVVRHHPRTIGTSKYGISRTWKVFFDLIAIKMIVSFASNPFHYFGMVSLPFLLLGLGTLWAIMLQYLSGIFHITIWGICMLSCFISFYLIVLGFFSEMILRTADNPSQEVVCSLY